MPKTKKNKLNVSVVFAAMIVIICVCVFTAVLPVAVEEFVESNEQELFDMPTAGYTDYGTDGRLDIPDLDIHVPLNHPADGQTRQDVVDDPSSALIMDLGTQTVIVDHVTSGRMRYLCESKLGMVALIVQEDGSYREFTCMQVASGYLARRSQNEFRDAFLYDGSRVRDLNAGGLCIMTCRMDQDPDELEKYGADCLVTFTFWQPVGD